MEEFQNCRKKTIKQIDNLTKQCMSKSSFDILNENKKFIFKKNKTENMMDYSDITKRGNIPKKVSFWKWQWGKILDNNE